MDRLDEKVVAVSGFKNVRLALEESRPGQIIEPLFCPRGCAGGPAGGHETEAFDARHQILDYAQKGLKTFNAVPPTPEQIAKESELTPEDEAFIETLTKYYDPPQSFKRKEVTETQIREVYEKTGKTAPEEQLNCSSCGYPSCRDMAIAVVEGLATLEMCVPYFRKAAEQRIDRVIETSPNGIVTLDEHLNIINMNPSFRQFFQCSNAVCGRPISYLMDPEPFERLLADPEKKIEIIVNHESYHLVCHEVLYSLPVEKQFVGIFMNITKLQKNEVQLGELQQQTVRQARELLQQQINMAETIAACLGENTARAESLLENLMDQAKQKE
jgi:PAS domain-containing protein